MGSSGKGDLGEGNSMRKNWGFPNKSPGRDFWVAPYANSRVARRPDAGESSSKKSEQLAYKRESSNQLTERTSLRGGEKLS